MKTRAKLYLFVVAAAIVATAVPVTEVWNCRFALAAEPPGEATQFKAIMQDQGIDSLLVTQLDGMDKTMRSRGMFRRGYRKLAVSGRLIALVGNIGTMTLSGDAAKKAATLREAGLKLAQAAEDKDYDSAKAAYEVIADYPQTIGPAAEAKAEPSAQVIAQGPLMKGVSYLDGALAKGVGASSASDFLQASETMAASAKLLACLAIVAHDYQPKSDWRQWSQQMRELSLKLAERLAQKDQPGAKQAREALLESCKSCHNVYRPDQP